MTQDDRKQPPQEESPHVRPMDDPTRGRQGDKLERELPHPERGDASRPEDRGEDKR